MRRFTTLLLATGLAGFTSLAHADSGMTPFSSVDGFLTYSNLDFRFADVGSGAGAVRLDDEDIGGGLRLRVAFGSYFFLQGGFQSVSINNPDTTFFDINADGSGATVRLREQLFEAGLKLGLMNDLLTPYVVVGEYRPRIQFNGFADPDQSARISDSGLIYGGGINLAVLDRSLHLSASYRRSTDLSDSEFDEILLGVAYQLSPSFGMFVEYRMAEFDFDGDQGKAESDDIRLGLRFSFGVESDGDFF